VAVDLFQQVGEADGLAQQLRVGKGRWGVHGGAGRDDERGERGEGGAAAQLQAQLPAAHDRHHQVDDEQGGRGAALQPLEGLGAVGDTAGHTYVVFGDGQFAASGDSGKSFLSSDGKSWQAMPGITRVRYCDGHLHSQADCPGFCQGGDCTGEIWLDGGILLRGDWPGKISRSTDGKTWQTVFNDPNQNTAYRFGAGFAAP